jgi:transposase
MEAHDQILCEHYGRMLGLTEGWKVSGVDLRLEEKRLELRLAWERSGAICPECGTSMNRHDLSPERKWRHLDSMGFETILLARIPRANCPEHGVSQMKVPWAEKHSRFTLAFEAFAIKVLQASRSVAAAQGLLRLNWESIHTIMERAVQRGVDRRSWEGVEMVGMDEKSFLRGQSYASVLYDLTPGQARVLEVMDGHDADAAEMLWEIIPDDVFEKIKAVCLDMSGTFASVARAMAPHIKVVHDRFHVSKHLNEAVDQVRRKENKILQAEGDERSQNQSRLGHEGKLPGVLEMQYLPRSGCLLQKMEMLGDEIRTAGNEKGRQDARQAFGGIAQLHAFPHNQCRGRGVQFQNPIRQGRCQGLP